MESKKPVLLIVDDKPSNLHILAELLGEEYDIKVAKDGKSALNVSDQIPKPDLILLDVMMPEMDGYDVCRRLKASDSTRRIPVIFLTAKSDATDEELGLSLGAIDYISKPFVPAIVKARIKTHLTAKFQHDKLLRQKEKLQKAMEQIKVLRGFLPICAYCKKIRDDQGYWNKIEQYISEHTEAEFSHGICPDCMAKVCPDSDE